MRGRIKEKKEREDICDECSKRNREKNKDREEDSTDKDKGSRKEKKKQNTRRKMGRGGSLKNRE